MAREKSLRTVTRKDIAKAAGVSETVVSYVINGNRYVKEEKRQRVEEAIKELNYRPNTMARALKGKRSHHILFIADDITGEYFGKLLGEIDRLAYTEDYFITLCADRPDEDFVNRIYSRFFDGIVIGSATFPISNIQRLIDTGLPVVLLEIRDYRCVTGSHGLINTGLLSGMHQAVNALHQRGRTHLLFIDRVSDSGNWSDMDDWRLSGFLTQCEALGIGHSVVSGCRSEEELLETLVFRLEGGLQVDGIIGRNDPMALIGIQACKRVGLDVPRDISVIGFDDSRLCRFTSPSLTSVAIPQKKIAKAVIEMMMNLIETQGESSERFAVYLDTALVMRESV